MFSMNGPRRKGKYVNFEIELYSCLKSTLYLNLIMNVFHSMFEQLGDIYMYEQSKLKTERNEIA